MALTDCRSCGAKISDEAAACPQCGHPQPKPKSLVWWIGAAMIVFIGYSCVRTSADKPSAQETAAPTLDTTALAVALNANRKPKWDDVEVIPSGSGAVRIRLHYAIPPASIGEVKSDLEGLIMQASGKLPTASFISAYAIRDLEGDFMKAYGSASYSRHVGRIEFKNP